jgi:L-lactate dehydrogenase (cytochrome)
LDHLFDVAGQSAAMTEAIRSIQSEPGLLPAATGASIARQQRLSRRLRRILSLNDFERLARRHLPRVIFAFVSGGVEDNHSLEDNRVAFSEIGFVPRFLVDISKRLQTTTLFWSAYASPFGIAPMGLMAMSAYRGDVVLAKAAAQENIPMIMSGSSLIRLEEVIQENANAWFQAYLPGDVVQIERLIERVERAGYRILVLSVDTPVAANRENNVRAGFSTPLRPSVKLAWDGLTHPAWSLGTFARTLLKHGMPHFENNYATRGAPILSARVLRDFSDRGHLNWQHFKRIRAMWKGKLVIKGILDRNDARIALDHGVDGVIVSNHGGRQLDGSIAPLRVLPEIAGVCGAIPVMMDSGIRRGTDVLKALALGAQFVFVGRPFNYAAAIAGEAGVRHAIGLLATEIDRDMAMLGVNTLGEIDQTRVRALRS